MFDENQIVLVNGRTRENPRYVLGKLDCDWEKIHDAVKAWGGPLPGRPEAIQEPPLRCEMLGYPPEHILAAAGVSVEDPNLVQYWQLRPEDRHVAIYHNRWSQVVFPELPAGVMLCGLGNEGGIREMWTWDEPCRMLSRKFYLVEAQEGAVRRKWPELTPALPDERWDECAYGIEFGLDLEILSISFYWYDSRWLTMQSNGYVEERRRVARMSLNHG